MEAWLTIIVRLVVIGLVAVVVGTALQSTSQQIAGKLFNDTVQPETEEDTPVASQINGSVWVAVADNKRGRSAASPFLAQINSMSCVRCVPPFYPLFGLFSIYFSSR